eukprot:4521733-Pyramimonas_sp.AAC.1
MSFWRGARTRPASFFHADCSPPWTRARQLARMAQDLQLDLASGPSCRPSSSPSPAGFAAGVATISARLAQAQLLRQDLGAPRVGC